MPIVEVFKVVVEADTESVYLRFTVKGPMASIPPALRQAIVTGLMTAAARIEADKEFKDGELILGDREDELKVQ